MPPAQNLNNRTALLPDQMQQELASMCMKPVFDEINALPGTETRNTVDNRNRQMRLSQRSADVCRHIVGAFGPVFEQRIAVGHKTRKESLQITQHFGISVFLNHKAG